MFPSFLAFLQVGWSSVALFIYVIWFLVLDIRQRLLKESLLLKKKTPTRNRTNIYGKARSGAQKQSVRERRGKCRNKLILDVKRAIFLCFC